MHVLLDRPDIYREKSILCRVGDWNSTYRQLASLNDISDRLAAIGSQAHPVTAWGKRVEERLSALESARPETSPAERTGE